MRVFFQAFYADGSFGRARWKSPFLPARPIARYISHMTLFRPCIDLHEGRVKQIVGASLKDDGAGLQTNFESDRSAAYYADLYRHDDLSGGHIIKLGPGNDEAAREALAAYPEGLQIGGGIHHANAQEWIAAGASHVIVTSCLFDAEGRFLEKNLDALVAQVGRERIVIDLSCRATDDGWVVAMDRWQKRTELSLEANVLEQLGASCDEFLVHAADVEGQCQGIDKELVQFLGECSPLPVTYAGGANSISDFAEVHRLSGGRVDLTIGSALDIFGGASISYEACLQWNRSRS